MDPKAAPRLASLANSRLRIRLLGRFELTSGNRLLRVTPAGERLLAYLAIRPDSAGRQAVALALWPECSDARAAANLRSALFRLANSRAPATPRAGGRQAPPAGTSGRWQGLVPQTGKADRAGRLPGITSLGSAGSVPGGQRLLPAS